MKSKNEILIRRRNKVIIDTQPKADAKFDIDEDIVLSSESPMSKYVVTIMKNIEDLGYTFSKELYKKALAFETVQELCDFYLGIIDILKESVGADKVYNPMYPNFPESVMKRSEFELYINAIIHYWSGGELYPVEKKNERLPLFDTTTVRVLDVGTDEDLKEIFTNLCQSKTSLSSTDKEDLSWLFANMDVEIPDEIPFKENVAIIGKLYIESSPKPSLVKLKKYFKTATDVLRLITAMSDGDVSLAANTKYRNLKRPERRIIMGLLNACNSPALEADMKRYKNRWIRVGEILHPSEYSDTKYPNVILAFHKLRENGEIITFSGKVEEALINEEYDKAINLLLKRPGEFARRLDQLLRKYENRDAIVNAFQKVANSVSTTALLQVREHFLRRSSQSPARVFFPKGNLATSYCIQNTLPPIPEKYCKAIVLVCENALINTFRQKDFMGNVYLSESFKNYIVPFSQRSASKALLTLTRGSRIPLDENTNTLRGFIWWTNDKDGGRVDLDITAGFFSDTWEHQGHISYTNLTVDEINACHSGDIVNGGSVEGDGVAEFIDIDVNSALDANIRFVVFQVYCFTRQKFSNLPNAAFGWMNREKADSGEIFEPKTVKQKLDLCVPGVVSIPVIFDCLKKELIWCDMSLGDNELVECCGRLSSRCNNIENNLRGVASTCYSMVNIEKPNLYDLIYLHIKARGLRVDNKDEADIIFDIEQPAEAYNADNKAEVEQEAASNNMDKDAEAAAVKPKVITPYDTDIFMGEYL